MEPLNITERDELSLVVITVNAEGANWDYVEYAGRRYSQALKSQLEWYRKKFAPLGCFFELNGEALPLDEQSVQAIDKWNELFADPDAEEEASEDETEE